VDSDNVEIIYSLRLMTSLWRHICKRFVNDDSRQNTAYSQHNSTTIINNNQLFNTNQQEYYCVIDELKCHNLFAKYPPFSLTQVWIRMSHPQHSVSVTLSCISGDRA